MNDWKACQPRCHWNTMLWCPILECFECAECCLGYTQAEYEALRDAS